MDVMDVALQAVDKPDSAERWLLASQLIQLRDCLRPGLTHLNWHALGIQDFVTPIYKVELIQHSHRLAMSTCELSPASLQPRHRYLGPVSCIELEGAPIIGYAGCL